jgi:NAD(P)H-nitrite reductase large subunit
VLVRAEGDGRVESATIAPCGPDWAPRGPGRTFAVDAVCTAYGFLPSVDLARALGCELRANAVAHDDDMATSVPGIYVAGEASGVGGADLAQVEGELAGWMAAAHTRTGNGHARPAVHPDLSGVRARRARLASFARILADLFDPRPGVLALAEPDTVLCRCEDVTRGAVDRAVARGATTMAAVKVVTRCGQGPCQGRMCERLVAARLPRQPAHYSGRAPLRPIPLEVLIKTAGE